MKKINITICEDENIITLDILNLLKSHGYINVVATDSADELIKIVVNSLPCLIITDVKLKGKRNGIEAVNEIAKAGKLFGVIYLTGIKPANLTINALSRLIKKPFDNKTLIKEVDNIAAELFKLKN